MFVLFLMMNQGSYRDQGDRGQSWSAAGQHLTGSEARQPPGAASSALNAHLIKVSVLSPFCSHCQPSGPLKVGNMIEIRR